MLKEIPLKTDLLCSSSKGSMTSSISLIGQNVLPPSLDIFLVFITKFSFSRADIFKQLFEDLILGMVPNADSELP